LRRLPVGVEPMSITWPQTRASDNIGDTKADNSELVIG
jgi:hypothetical protein